MQVLDSNDIELNGTHLIEASAGTGKTYTITTLVLRLLVEAGLPIDAICVVTFTEAATAELRERIRTRIKCVIDGLSNRPVSDDAFVSACAALSAGNQERCRRRLQQALSRFDEAAIYTIHGFCRRLLCDFAYESGMQFDTELVTSQEQLVQETVDDFWRRTAGNISPLLSAWLLEKKIDPDALVKLAGQVLGNPLMRVVPAAEPVDTAGPESSFAAAFQAAAQLWSSHGSDVKNLLIASESLNKGTYKPAAIEAWAAELDVFFGASAPPCLPPDALEKFSIEMLEKKCKKNCPAPQHLFFESARRLWAAAEHLCASYDAHILYLKTALCACVRSDITRRKHADNTQFFDDLLLGVHASLQGPEGPAFAARVRARFQAALIDEFQDTDQLQYEIFKNIFEHPDTSLFFIGDPKQAIYSFRSADVYTYLAAAAAAGAEARKTLTVNWRSTPGLIRALELLFKNHASPFALEQIPFVPVHPADVVRGPLMIRGAGAPALQVRLLACNKERNSKKGALLTPQARTAICADMASEIAGLLDGSAMLDNRAVEPADIAVLVRTHSQARMVQTALRARGIACIVQNSGNVFASPEASDMALLLAGVAAPDSVRMVRSALATRLLGFTAGRLQALDEDAAQWMAELERFGRFNRLWRAEGFSAMLRSLLFEYSVLSRLAGLPGGERSITNVLHLAELLQERSTRDGAGMWELQRWFARQLGQDEEDSEAFLLRLESDRRAVRIMTMFKSKGLEFEIVFCPFAWGGSKVAGAGFVYHEQQGVRALDLGSEQIEEHRRQAETEELAENLRLLYVALTRARRRCCLYWGALPGADTSAPAWLFHNRETAGPPMLAALEQRFLELSDADILEHMQRLAAQAPECIEVCCVQASGAAGALNAQVQPAELACRTFAGRIHMPWRITSFSALVSGRVHEAEVQERDSDAHVADPVLPAGVLLEAPVLPPGANTGTMLHAVLERFTFSRSPELETLVAETLVAHQIDQAWGSVVIDMVGRSAVQTLASPFGSFCLADTDASSRVSEMGFYVPLKHTSSRSLQELFSNRRIAHVPETFADTLGRLVFSPVHGFLKGFIDLVFEYKGRFYLIDWKSNLLGPDRESYRRERLGAVMARDYYILQYHLYALALHAWLGCRMRGYDYEQHFGGVFYMFLRGLGPDNDPDCGVFYDRPEYGFMQAMAQALLDTGETHAV